MVIYTHKHGYRKRRRWPYLVLVSVMLIASFPYVLGDTTSSTKSEEIAVVTKTTQPVAPPLPAAQDYKISTLPWPSYGQAAYGIVEDGTLAQSTEDTNSVPIASLAKVITALAVLEKKPLAVGEEGPLITFTDEDVRLYHEYVAKNGTVVPVEAGAQISQYQALQAMLLPSGNNISDSLAIWAFGSIEEYNVYANDMLARFDLSSTIVADASGYSSDTKSTASEMVEIGILYMQNPTLVSIASQTDVLIPEVGSIQNKNSAINSAGLVGIKIGFTEDAGFTFLVADAKSADKDDISVAVVLGASSLPKAMQDASELLETGSVKHRQLVEEQQPG